MPVVGVAGGPGPRTRSTRPHAPSALLVLKQPAELRVWSEEQHTSPSSLRGASYLSADVWDEVLGLRRDDLWGVQNVFSLSTPRSRTAVLNSQRSSVAVSVGGAQCSSLASF